MVSLGERASFKPLYINKAEVIQGGEADPVVCITLTSILYKCKSNALYLRTETSHVLNVLTTHVNKMRLLTYHYSTIRIIYIISIRVYDI